MAAKLTSASDVPPDNLATEKFCYLTTTGRITDQPRTIEIWFALQGSTLYMLAGDGERANWVKNAHCDPAVRIRIGAETFAAQARPVAAGAEDALARRLLHDKYADDEWATTSLSLADWARTSLPMAFDLR